MWGQSATAPRPVCSGAWGAAHVLGSSVPWFSHLGLRVLLFSLAQPSSVGSIRWVHALGTGSLGTPKCTPGQEHLLWLPYSPRSISATSSCRSHSLVPSHLPSRPESTLIPLFPPTQVCITPEQPQLIFSSVDFEFFLFFLFLIFFFLLNSALSKACGCCSPVPRLLCFILGKMWMGKG